MFKKQVLFILVILLLKKFRFYSFLITFLLFSHVLPSQAQYESVPFSVIWNNSRLSVTANGVSPILILCEVSRQTGIEIQVSENLHEPITANFSNLTLHDGLKALLTHMNYVIYKKSSSRVYVQILGIRNTHSSESLVSESAIAPEDDSLGNDQQGADVNTRLLNIQELCKTNSPHNEDALCAATHDQDPSVRELAYKLLYEKNNKKALNILIDNAKNSDDNIRKTAIIALGEFTGSDVIPVLQDATEDPDIDIRYTAFQQLSQISSQEGIAVLKSRLTHINPEIRMMAFDTMVAKGEEFALEAARLIRDDKDELVSSKAEGLISEFEAREVAVK